MANSRMLDIIIPVLCLVLGGVRPTDGIQTITLNGQWTVSSQGKIKVIGAALKCAPIMEWEFILASGRSSF